VAELLLPRDAIFPDRDEVEWRANEHWLARFWEPSSDLLVAAVRTWVLRSEGRTILVDTGIGNHKQRPGNPPFHMLRTDFLDNLAAAGVHPDDVDLVVCTHVHGDHVGWNTRLVDGEWVPTFRNARHVIPRADFDYWNPVNGHQTRSGPRFTNVFEDSVEPVHRAGLTVLWEDHYDVDTNALMLPAHFPAPGAVEVRADGSGYASKPGRRSAKGSRWWSGPLSAEVDTATAVLAVDPGGIDDQADPWPGYVRGAQIDIPTDEPVLAVPARLDKSLLSGVIPVEQDVDPFPNGADPGVALLPGEAFSVPAARPVSFDRRQRQGGRAVPGLGVVVVGRPGQPDVVGESRHVVAVGVRHVRYAEGVSARARCFLGLAAEVVP
jgi:hypothetical protein